LHKGCVFSYLYKLAALCYTDTKLTNICYHKWVSAHFFYCNIALITKKLPGVILLGKVQDLENLIMRELEQHNIELVALEYRKENREQMLRIFIDCEAGVDLDLCTQVTRMIKPLVDEGDFYYDHLEVSSPGLDRPLKNDKDFLRFQGYMVKIKMLKEYDGANKITGVLSGVNDKYILVKVDENILDLPRESLSTVRLHPDY
jgi:ribosome maturation factor RimP